MASLIRTTMILAGSFSDLKKFGLRLRFSFDEEVVLVLSDTMILLFLDPLHYFWAKGISSIKSNYEGEVLRKLLSL